MNNLSIILPNQLRRVKVDKNDPYKAINEYWYYAPISGGKPVNEFILLDGYALINRGGEVPLVGMGRDLFDEIITLSQPPGKHYVKCCVVFVDEIEENEVKYVN